MLNKKLIGALLGGVIFLLVSYGNVFSQALPSQNLSFGSEVASPADTHCIYKPGDFNGDGKVSLPDIILIVQCVYIYDCCLLCPTCLIDVNADGRSTLADIVYLVNYIFRGGPAPVKSGVCCL